MALVKDRQYCSLHQPAFCNFCIISRGDCRVRYYSMYHLETLFVQCTVHVYMYSVSQKIPHLSFSDISPKRLGIFSPNFTCLLCVPIYAKLQIFTVCKFDEVMPYEARPPS